MDEQKVEGEVKQSQEQGQNSCLDEPEPAKLIPDTIQQSKPIKIRCSKCNSAQIYTLKDGIRACRKCGNREKPSTENILDEGRKKEGENINGI